MFTRTPEGFADLARRSDGVCWEYACRLVLSTSGICRKVTWNFVRSYDNGLPRNRNQVDTLTGLLGCSSPELLRCCSFPALIGYSQRTNLSQHQGYETHLNILA